MTKVERIKTEYADGSVGGAIYGSKVRVVMRSPKAFIFTGYGLNMIERGSRYRADKIAEQFKPHLMTDAVKAKIVAAFGEGADIAVMEALAVRGQGTVLFDGGGDPLPLPAHEQRKNIHAEYDAVSPSMRMIPESAKKCRQCGAGLRLHTVRHSFTHRPTSDQPKTLEECQRLSNHPVVAISGYGINRDREHWAFVESFETWDGESYTDGMFCNDKCAAIFGRRAADQIDLPVGGAAPPRPKNQYERRALYDEAEEAEKSRLSLEATFKKHQIDLLTKSGIKV